MEESSQVDHISFDHVVHEARALPFFLDFLSQIERVELLFFWLEVEEYKQLTGRTGDLLAQANKIFDKYFDGNDGNGNRQSTAPRSFLEGEDDDVQDDDQEEVSLSSLLVETDTEREWMMQQVKEGMPTLDMFTKAQFRVENVLRTEYFPAFRESRSYRALLEELKNRRPLTVLQVLNNPVYLNHFQAFIEYKMTASLGNLLFYMHIVQHYRPRVIRGPLENAAPTSSTSPTVTIASPKQQALNPTADGKRTVEAEAPTTSPADNPSRKKQLRSRKSHSVFSYGRWESSSTSSSQSSQSSVSSSSSPYHSERVVAQASPGSTMRKELSRIQSLREATSRPSSFIDILPVSAALPSVSSQLTNRRSDLLEILNLAYQALDKFLSRSSVNEATLVSDESRVAVAHELEKINGELGGGSGKLSSVSGFASIGTAFSVLDALRTKLEDVFSPAEKDVLVWMQEVAFPAFKETEYYASLICRIEEEESEAHRERNHLDLVLRGEAFSEKLLVLRLPSKSSVSVPVQRQPEQQNDNNRMMNKHERKRKKTKEVLIQEEKDRMEFRRRASFLWNGKLLSGSHIPVANKVVALHTYVAADERPLPVLQEKVSNFPCECSCHYDSSESVCTCACNDPCLSFRSSGVLFRTKLSLNETVGPMQWAAQPESNVQPKRANLSNLNNTDIANLTRRISEEEEENDSDYEDPCQTDNVDPTVEHDDRSAETNGMPQEQSPSSPSNDELVEEKSSNRQAEENKGRLESLVDDKAPPELSAYLLPTGLNVRIIHPEQIEEELSHRLKSGYRARSSSDPENVGGLLSVPPKPRGISFKKTHVLPVIDDACKGSLVKEDYDVQLVHPQDAEAATTNDDTGEGDMAFEDMPALENRLSAFRPPSTTHCFAMPCRRLKNNAKSSKVRHWYGVCHTSFKLVRIDCLTKTSPDKTNPQLVKASSSSAINNNEREIPLENETKYEEIVIKLSRHPSFGLGLNLTLNLHGFIAVTDFVTRPDGSTSPAARSGALRSNDVLISLNGISVASRRFEEVIKQIVQAKEPLEFVFARGWSDSIKSCAYCAKPLCVPSFAFVPECVAVLSFTRPQFASLKQILSCLHTAPESTLAQAVEAENNRIIDSAQTSKTSDRDSPGLLLCPRPPAPEVPFKQLFRFLRKEHVADVLAALLVNRPVIMLSDSPTLLTFVGQSFRSLLWPFVWRHVYCPVLPIPLLRNFAIRRARKMSQVESMKAGLGKDHLGDLKMDLITSFFIGVCTLELGARDTNLGEFVGYDDIRDWMLQEHDNLRPFDRFVSIKALTPLLAEGTIVLDIDSDSLEVPRPSKRDEMELHSLQQVNGNNLDTPSGGGGGQVDMRRGSSATPGRFSLQLFRYDETSINRRLRTSSATSASSFLSGSFLSTPTTSISKSHVPSFPETLRDRLLEDWESIPPSSREFEVIHAKLMRLHSSMLSAYREYFVTFEQRVEGDTVLAFDIRAFLSKCPRLYRPYLRLFLRTKSFACFLVESVFTKCEFFSRRDNVPSLLMRSSSIPLNGLGSPSSTTSSPRHRRSDLGLDEIPEIDSAVEREEMERARTSQRSIQPSSRARSSSSPSPRRRRAASHEKELKESVKHVVDESEDEQVDDVDPNVDWV